ncbi:hypothetical protein BDZ89DRAFT_1252504 [Hymenopellis radicata]|nr:hypothetical protein BDZ89DRAFT_1252504 [Hymenopellis radicata]
MELHEGAEKNIVTASFGLPGLEEEDVSIDVHDERLTITGERKISTEERYAVKERKFGKFARTLIPQVSSC